MKKAWNRIYFSRQLFLFQPWTSIWSQLSDLRTIKIFSPHLKFLTIFPPFFIRTKIALQTEKERKKESFKQMWEIGEKRKCRSSVCAIEIELFPWALHTRDWDWQKTTIMHALVIRRARKKTQFILPNNDIKHVLRLEMLLYFFR